MKLDKDCSISAFNLEKKDAKVEVDLATHTLTLSAVSQISATASFKNGNISTKEMIKGMGGKLKFDKVHISGPNYALWVQGPNAKLEVINGSLIEANYFLYQQMRLCKVVDCYMEELTSC